MISAYPLQWPQAYPRSKSRGTPQFKSTFGRSRDELIEELRRLGATEVILSSMIPVRGDGLPYADFERRIITDPGVAVYFKWKGSQRVLACDKWQRVEHNVHALKLSIEAMRGLDRWGASSILERAFTGFTALPAPEQWWDVLQVDPQGPLTSAEARYKMMIRLAHPDAGGSEQKAAKLNWAIARAREEMRA